MSDIFDNEYHSRANTLQALQGSIQKWERVVAEGQNGITWTDCPLCVLFYKHGGCFGCPIREKTGERVCNGTPYESYVSAFYSDDGDERLERIAVAARAELEFLKSLQPKEKTDE